MLTCSTPLSCGGRICPSRPRCRPSDLGRSHLGLAHRNNLQTRIRRQSAFPARALRSLHNIAVCGHEAGEPAQQEDCVFYTKEQYLRENLYGSQEFVHPVHGHLFAKQTRSAALAAHEEYIFGRIAHLQAAGIVPKLYGRFKVDYKPLQPVTALLYVKPDN